MLNNLKVILAGAILTVSTKKGRVIGKDLKHKKMK